MLAAVIMAGVLGAPAAPAAVPAFRDLERRSGGRLGVAVLDTGNGRRWNHRGAERFPLCSTFKALLAGAVLAEMDAGKLRLEDRLPLTKADLVPWAPLCETRVAEGAVSVRDLCEAAVQVSDNTAANLLLRRLGGPQALTAWLRHLGDRVTRLDRWEPDLNDAKPGDPRDTTSPEALLGSLQALLQGNALTPASRNQLRDWMAGCRTGDRRLRAGLPATWKVMDKTGSGERGTVNHVALVEPPGRAPVYVVAYLTGGKGATASLEKILAEVGREAAVLVLANP